VIVFELPLIQTIISYCSAASALSIEQQGLEGLPQLIVAAVVVAVGIATEAAFTVGLLASFG